MRLPRVQVWRALVLGGLTVATLARCGGGGGPSCDEAPSSPGCAQSQSASLVVTVTGLPGTVNPQVSVSGPNGFTRTITAPGGTTLSFLAPGAYTVTASPVTGGGVTYDGAASPSQLTLAAGQQGAVTVTYTASALLTIAGGGAGDGSGTVTAPAAAGKPAVNCAITSGAAAAAGCTESYPHGTTVTLTATAAGGGHAFTGWSEAACPGTGPCTVTLNGNRTVTARFRPPPTFATLTITGGGAGTGPGRVTSSPAGIDCTIDASGQAAATGCSGPFTPNATVRLSAVSGVLLGWGGPCINVTAPAPCDVVMAGNQTVPATFDIPRPVIQPISAAPFNVVGALDPTTVFVFPVLNAGSGTLVLQPNPAVTLNKGTGWLVAETENDPSPRLKLTVDPTRLRPLDRQDFKATVVLAAQGTTRTATMVVTIKARVNAPPVVASRIIYFHNAPGNNLPTLNTVVKVLQQGTGASLAGLATVAFDPNNWLSIPSTLNANSELFISTFATSSNGLIPDGTIGVRIRVSTPTFPCPQVNPDPRCTFLVRYTFNQDPEMRLAPWGLVFTAATPGPLESAVNFYNGGPGFNVRVLPDNCGPWVTNRQVVTGNRVRVSVDLEQVPADTTVSCQIPVVADISSSGQPDTTRRELEVIATNGTPDQVQPEFADLALAVQAGGTTSQTVNVYNFGVGSLTLTAATIAAGSCPAGLLSASVARGPALNDDPLTTVQAQLSVNAAGQPPGTCQATLQLRTQFASFQADVPITVLVR